MASLDKARQRVLRIYDNMLHQTLRQIFHERHFISGRRIEEILRNESSRIKPILEQEAFLSEHFSKEELEELPLLWIAVLCRYENSVELLVRSGADVNERFGLDRIGLKEQSTVLHAMLLTYSCSPEHERLIRLVTDHGAYLQARDDMKLTVLHYAVMLGRVELAETFLESGADVSVADDRGRTPFALVADEKNLKNPMVKLIVKALALKKVCQPLTIELKDEKIMNKYPELWDHYEDCIEHAYRTKFTRFAKSCTFFQLLAQCPCSIALLMRADLDFVRNFGLYDLSGFFIYADEIQRAFERAQNFYYSMLEQESVIMEVKPSQVDLRDAALYLHPCYCNYLSIRICEKDTDPAFNPLDPILERAIWLDKVEMAEWLLQKGANVDAVDAEHGVPRLHLAALISKKADRMVPLLMKHGADVLAKDNDGGSVLHHLGLNDSVNCTDLARIFIEKGVSVNDRANGKYHCYDQLIHLAAERGKNELLKLLLDHGANVNAQTKDGESPLYLAAEESNKPVLVQTLLEHGADIDLRTIEGRTALHAACQWPQEESIIRLLVSAGADVLAEDRDGLTPFALIARCDPESRSIRLMMKALALKKFCQPSIDLKDERIMKKCPQLWDYYRDCEAHVSRMKYTRLIKGCTFFDLLTRNRFRIATLMRNPDFEANFKLYDLNGFSMYAEDILGAFECARNYCSTMLEQEDLINEAFYYTLPDVVVRKVVRCILSGFEE